MKHLLAFLIAPTVTTIIVSVTYGLAVASPMGAWGMAMIFGTHCCVFTALIGLPGHLMFCFFKVRSVVAYALFGFLSGAALIQFLAGCDLNGRALISVMFFGIVGMLNAIVFAVSLKKLSAKQGAGGEPLEADQLSDELTQNPHEP